MLENDKKKFAQRALHFVNKKERGRLQYCYNIENNKILITNFFNMSTKILC